MGKSGTRSSGRKKPTTATSALALIPAERVERSILTIRGQRVILDSGLAVLFGVTTKRLNEQVRRNRDRFPPDFMFQLSQEEFADLRSQLRPQVGAAAADRPLPSPSTGPS